MKNFYNEKEKLILETHFSQNRGSMSKNNYMNIKETIVEKNWTDDSNLILHIFKQNKKLTFSQCSELLSLNIDYNFKNKDNRNFLFFIENVDLYKKLLQQLKEKDIDFNILDKNKKYFSEYLLEKETKSLTNHNLMKIILENKLENIYFIFENNSNHLKQNFNNYLEIYNKFKNDILSEKMYKQFTQNIKNTIKNYNTYDKYYSEFEPIFHKNDKYLNYIRINNNLNIIKNNLNKI